MQSIQSQLKFRCAVIEYKLLLIIFISLLITILSACTDQPSTSAVKQPTATPYVLMLFAIPSDELGIVVDENNQVLEITAGSAAEQSGMQVGDVLDSIDGVSFKEKEKVKEKIREQKKDKKFKVKLKRNDKEVRFDIVPSPPVPRSNAPTPTPVFSPQDFF